MIRNEFLLAVCGGAALALPYVMYARRVRDGRGVFGAGLTVAALVYVGFAVAGGSVQELLIELMGIVVFAVFAFLGARRSGYFLAVGWALHVSWDVLLHPRNPASYVPWWYPPVCIGFDLVVAGAVFRASRKSIS